MWPVQAELCGSEGILRHRKLIQPSFQHKLEILIIWVAERTSVGLENSSAAVNPVIPHLQIVDVAR
jgi:hypothetical protein